MRRCLHDSELPLDVRGAGALTLLYGLPVTRILELRADDLVTDGRKRFLLLNGHRIALPPTVARLLDQCSNEMAGGMLAGRTGGSVHYVFPSALTGRGLHAGGLSKKLRRYGFPGRRGRNSALLALATGMPAATLSDTLGISITSAVQWTKRSKRDWHAYLKARAEAAR